MKPYFKVTLLFISLLTGFGFKANAQYVKVESSIDRNSMPIGDQTILHVSASMPLKTDITFPEIVDSIGKVKIVKSLKADTVVDKNNSNLETISHSYTVTSFDSGVYVLPQFTFHTKAGDIKTGTITLQIKSVPVDTTKAFYDIKQPLAVSYNLWDWIKDHWGILAVILFMALWALGIIYYIKNKPKPAEYVEPSQVYTTDEIAINKLNALNGKKLWQQGDVKLYYIELTEILRDYLEKRYLIQAHEQTTDQIFDGLKSKALTKESSNVLFQILKLADLVKFAKQQPTAYENEQSIENAIIFIQQTRVVPQPIQNKEELPK
ncbi:MAG: hypothetical protein ACHQF4_00855 [Sphingobacteriales bacterium]